MGLSCSESCTGLDHLSALIESPGCRAGGAVCGPLGQTNTYVLKGDDLLEFVSGPSQGWNKMSIYRKSNTVFAANFSCTWGCWIQIWEVSLLWVSSWSLQEQSGSSDWVSKSLSCLWPTLLLSVVKLRKRGSLTRHMVVWWGLHATPCSIGSRLFIWDPGPCNSAGDVTACLYAKTKS